MRFSYLKSQYSKLIYLHKKSSKITEAIKEKNLHLNSTVHFFKEQKEAGKYINTPILSMLCSGQ